MTYVDFGEANRIARRALFQLAGRTRCRQGHPPAPPVSALDWIDTRTGERHANRAVARTAEDQQHYRLRGRLRCDHCGLNVDMPAESIAWIVEATSRLGLYVHSAGDGGVMGPRRRYVELEQIAALRGFYLHPDAAPVDVWSKLEHPRHTRDT